MGQNRRYERYARPVDPETEDEAAALRTIAGLLETGTPLITDARLASRIAAIFRATAVELSAGRAVPLQLRHAVRRAADNIRARLDPRDPTSRQD
ncbi:hypothetical protein Psed_6818 (plasmid) [Pseudonocardia dioxanivorans CB1190]|uniref:Uncharacterized protein n=1 Tax=Pseudonocardia dioxanivorans (strain ATCC 55486 / DSM 44775 / JCM 13855 / CB1190) TaxID=675635 RepID=F2L6J5_PSEUX|nr:hypothetical protein [Pseudonocardia dioxanivorans]AEA28889.1 hypothetical protein Psed_6818 [Pseudonocardia dioxanivorans CB1190]